MLLQAQKDTSRATAASRLRSLTVLHDGGSPLKRAQQQACLLSCASRASSIWLTALPIHTTVTLSNNAYCNAFQFRLGLAPRPLEAPRVRCGCGALADPHTRVVRPGLLSGGACSWMQPACLLKTFSPSGFDGFFEGCLVGANGRCTTGVRWVQLDNTTIRELCATVEQMRSSQTARRQSICVNAGVSYGDTPVASRCVQFSWCSVTTHRTTIRNWTGRLTAQPRTLK